MMKDSGMLEVTDAEVAFAFNILANFKKHINKTVFLDWIHVILYYKCITVYRVWIVDPRRD